MKQDAVLIGQVAKDQADAGADFIGVNAGTFADREIEFLCWLVDAVQDAVKKNDGSYKVDGKFRDVEEV